MTKYASGWPPLVLPHTATQPGALAGSDLIRAFAGGACTLLTHTLGKKQDDEEVRAPLNPSGELGHDHSGGYFGAPLYRSIASWHFNTGEHYDSNSNGHVHYIKLLTSSGNASTDTEGSPWSITFWCPPCPTGEAAPGAYVDPGVVLVLDYDHTTGTNDMKSDDTVEIIFRPRGRHYNEHGTVDALTLSVSSPATSEEKVLESGAGTRLTRVVPGAFNTFDIYARAERSATAGDARQGEFKLLYLDIGVYA